MSIIILSVSRLPLKIQLTVEHSTKMKTIVYSRKIEGISAILLPYHENGRPDFDSFLSYVDQTYSAGLTPAINMDTGYVNLLTREQRLGILDLMPDAANGRRFIAGAFIEGETGDLVSHYYRETDAIQHHGGIPILFQSTALTSLPDDKLVDVYRKVAAKCNSLIAFELGKMFAPFGAIYSLEVFQEIMQIPQIVGIKHSSLKRELEWQRLELRDKLRPDFKIYTGNDLAIDMIMYGSDYLLGLSTFAPDYFAKRDEYWLKGDSRFYELNDVLQYLGQFAFRSPTTAYKHSAAQFLKLRGWIESDEPHPNASRRPESDIEILQNILEQLETHI
jgi:dihydrodipicolinate synthase/N-acetylneuraminate lyase